MMATWTTKLGLLVLVSMALGTACSEGDDRDDGDGAVTDHDGAAPDGGAPLDSEVTADGVVGDCGDGVCQPGESVTSCPGDCPAVCDDGECSHDEDAATCPEDCAPGCGGLFFVAATGDDGDDGSAASPWQTVDHVNQASLVAGDCVFFRRGDVWPEGVDAAWSGTAAQPILMAAYGVGAAPVLERVTIHHEDHLTVRGLHLEGSPGFGISVYDGHHITVEDTEVNHATISNIYAGPADDFVLRRVVSHHAQSEHGLYLSGETSAATNDPLVEDSVFYSNTGAGIQLNSATTNHVYRPILRRNLLYDNQMGINDLASNGGLYHHNILHSNNAAVIYFHKDPLDDGSFAARNTQFVNNVIYNDPAPSWDDVVWVGADNTGIEVRNNIIYAPGAVLVIVEPMAEVQLDHNVLSTGAYNWKGTACFSFSDWQSESGQDVHSLQADPLFVNVPVDFHVQASSPCVDAGEDVGLSQDCDQVAIPQGQGVDIGAYEQ